MCDVRKVHTHPIHPECWIISDEMEEIEIESIGMIVSAPLTFKETNGQIVPLTQEVIVYFLFLVL
jgi:folate-dependent tRNA-U54 methylase TrmFO/GidA